MELFLPNVPSHLNTRSLRNELSPMMEALSIKKWDCEKSNRKPIGWIFFLHEAEGKSFLTQYGWNELTKICYLVIMKSTVKVIKSNRAPNQFALSQLRLEPDDKQTAQNRPVKTEQDGIVFEHHAISCGNYTFIANTLSFVQEWTSNCLATRFAKFARKDLIVEYRLPSGDEVVVLHIPYDTILLAEASLKHMSITLLVKQPPIFFKKGGPAQLTLPSGRNGPALTRTTGLCDGMAASCLAYKLQIASSSVEFVAKIGKVEKMGFFNLTTADTPCVLTSSPDVRLPYSSHYRRFMTNARTLTQTAEVPFGILFQMQSLVVNHCLSPKDADTLLHQIASLFRRAKVLKQRPPLSVETIMVLQKLDNPWHSEAEQYHPENLMRILLECEVAVQEQGHMRTLAREQWVGKSRVWVFRAQVTPSRILLHGPELESSNHVLRKFSKNIDCFLRVQFCDEDGLDLFFTSSIAYDEIFNRFLKILREGIEVCGRTYLFLGFSHSSLRSRSAWFSAPWVEDGHIRTAVKIISMLGNFDKIRVAAKYAARIGQAFSETPYAISLTENDIKLEFIPDVKSHDQLRVFSDGVGTLSADTMEKMLESLPWRKGSATCFQIRLGGIKGMLSLDSRLNGSLIRIRKESMMKFESDDMDTIGICDVANRPLKLFLNRQIIKLLEDMGVSPRWFHGLQRDELDVLCSVTSAVYKTCDFLKSQSIGSSFGFSRLIDDLDHLGIDYREDNFLRAVVENVVLREVRLLKYKSRIPVPKGVTLFGILDETGFLREHEVYIALDLTHRSVRNFMDRSLGIRTMPVLVTRSPALHPGDVQLAYTATPPMGHPIRDNDNCIVFSSQGMRDLPSKLSGGDLDGDMYHVIWDTDAIFRDKEHTQFVKLYEPADYPRVEAPALARKVEREDIMQHFIDFMKSDQLGVIATRHLILCDQRDTGALDPDCVTLAHLHSTAVDFSKTGVPVDFGALHKIKVLKYRPDFLAPAPPLHLHDLGQIAFLDIPQDDRDADEVVRGTARHRFYKSEKVLGELYRSIDERKIWRDKIHVNVPASTRSVWDRFVEQISRRMRELSQGQVNWARKSKDAWKLRGIYEDQIMDIKRQFSANMHESLRELEIFCGFIFNKNGSQTRRQRDDSTKIYEAFQVLTEWLSRQLRYGVDSVTQSERGDDHAWLGNQDALERCWAALMVGGSRENFPSSYGGNGELESFRVVAASCLIKEMKVLKNARTMTTKDRAKKGRGNQRLAG